MRVACEYRPLRMLMRDGLHWGEVPKAYRTSSPARASRSMFGVRTAALP